jgi:N utilization substance protein B
VDQADLGAGTKACKTTIHDIFEAEQRQLDPLILLVQPITQPGMEAALPHYSVETVEGVVADHDRIAELLSTLAHRWTLDRIPALRRVACASRRVRRAGRGR